MNTTHEDFGAKTVRRGPSDRNFGFVFTAAFLLFGLVPLRHGRPVRAWCLAVSGAFLLVTIVRPSLLHTANRLWVKLGLLLGRIVNPIVTGLLFYLVFTPAAMIMRWAGKDPMRLRMDKDAKTYWQPREGQDLSDMTNQF
jgi:hypothetical protein